MTTEDHKYDDVEAVIARLCQYEGRHIVTDEEAWRLVAPFESVDVSEAETLYDEEGHPWFALQKMVADAVRQAGELPAGEAAAMEWRQVVGVSTVSERLAMAVGVEVGARGQYVGRGSSADARHNDTMENLLSWAVEEGYLTQLEAGELL
jgi:hypothetical protein